MKSEVLINKPMQYKEHCTEVIGYGTYKGFTFLVANYGNHPCAYVHLPKDHRFSTMSEDTIDQHVKCHGGITFVGHLTKFDGIILNGLCGDTDTWIGWDYLHSSDYSYHRRILPGAKHLHQWTTDEIIGHIKEVIEQL